MKQRRLLFAAIACTLLSTLATACPSAAQESGQWRASSSSAKSITGDVDFSTSKLAINFTAFPIALLRSITPVEATALFNDDSSAGAGNLYRLDIPSSKKFLHHNTLCGSDDAQWAVTWVQGRTLQLALFSGSATPTLTVDSLLNTSTLCNTFTYIR
jgi:hypothetical protein